MTPEQRVFTFISTISLAFTCVIIFKLAGHFLRKRALENVKKQLTENEYIVYDSKIKSIIFEVFIPLAIGGFIGYFMMPLFVYPEIRNVGLMYRFELPFWSIGIPFTSIVLLQQSIVKQILTNQRIIFVWPFDFLYKYTEFETKYLRYADFYNFQNLEYSDIKKIEYQNFLGLEVLYIHTHGNKIHKIGVFKDLKKVKSILEEYSNMSDKEI